MAALSPGRLRVLPATIGVMALLMAVKSAGLVSAAMAGGTAPASEPGMAAAAPPAPAEGARPAASPDSAPAPAPGAPHLVTPSPRAEVPEISPAERALLLDLRHRHDTLEARARALDQREAVLGAAETRLAARVAELDALQRKLQALETARHAHDSANWAGLVKLYEAMKPRDAAAIFDSLDMQVLLPVLDRMSERKAAPVLAAMQPDRARLATQMLAELRTRSITPEGEKPAAKPDPKG